MLDTFISTINFYISVSSKVTQPVSIVFQFELEGEIYYSMVLLIGLTN